MCTYLTEKIAIEGSGKGQAGWFALTEAQVYIDHAGHAQYTHTVNIDFTDPAAGRRGPPPRHPPSPATAPAPPGPGPRAPRPPRRRTEAPPRPLAEAITAAIASAPP